MKLRVGLVGLGEAWQQRYAPALRALADRFEVRAVYDQVHHRAQQAAAEYRASAVDGYRALANREDVDAVLILAWQWAGHLPILAACEAGKAVYCATGMNLEPAEAEQVKRRVEEAGIAFMAEFPRRLAPATIRLKELIATRLGTPRLLFCHRRTLAQAGAPAARAGQNWAACDLIELVDWCSYVVDRPPTSVIGLAHQSLADPDQEDYRMMSLDFSEPGKHGSGPVAQISCGRYIPSHWQEAVNYRPLAALQVSCERGIAFVDLPASLVWFDEAGRHQETLEHERPIGELLLMQFFRSVTSLLRRSSDLEDAHRAVRIVQQAQQSHQQGRRVPVE